MRIAFVGVSHLLDSNRIGGIQSIIKTLSSYLTAQNHTVCILSYGNHSIFTGSKARVRRELLKHRFDVINFIQTPFSNPFFTGLFFLQKRKWKTQTIKMIFTYPPFRHTVFLQLLKYKMLIDKCITFSWRLTEEVQKVAGRVYFMYPPVSHQFYTTREKRRQRKKSHLLYCGRLSADKGLDIVIDIFRHLDRDRFSMSIAGYYASERDKAYYEQKIKALDLEEFISLDSNILLQNLPHPHLDQYDILLLPYQNLTPTLDLPLLVLEGLAAGCRVITSQIGDIPKLEGNISCVKDYSNPQAFEKTINREEKEPTRHFTHSEFSVQTVGKKYMEILHQ